ncbi:uncharacterized protein Tco025E_02084 [Trypanosoma conorhini]|uniref:Uncharacterized protein n=1 Tax=Trypanosoma conorhini TaxID=83891 RepID=A0A3R7LCM1_9TRYP|nr:uncharacterized protein Tco025E_02084 [Trypanosoma conorhini]RNF25680.1 hypothetical protein Tco025E_02084 [Trypanosoma conorhini]
MERQCLASSILQPLAPDPGTTTSAASVTRQKRARDSFLYDRNGKRLKGLKGEAAKLMHNHRFFSSAEEMHHLEQTLAVGQRSMDALAGGSGGGAGGAGTHKLPALPDMFGVVLPTAASGGGTAEAVNGEGVALGAVVPPMHRWSLVQRRLVAVAPQSRDTAGPCASSPAGLPRVGASGYRWVRADALLVENALMSAALAEKEEDRETDGHCGGGGGDCRCGRVDLPGSWLAAQHLSVPPEVELSVLHASTEPSPFAFLTVSAEEYAAMGLGGDAYQPAVLSHEGANDAGTERWRFDFASTCKLLALYEQFGNFAVVADRWRYTCARDTPAGSMATSTHAAPPVEVLMERYKLVSEAVLCHRLRRLQEALEDEEGAKAGGGAALSPSCSSKPHKRVAVGVSPTGERAPASTHPLISLMEKHPVLVARRRRQEWLTQRYQELSGGADPVPSPHEEAAEEASMLARHRAEVMQRCVESSTAYSASPAPSRRPISQAACKGNGGKADVSLFPSSFPPPPASPFWYDGLLEQSRRRRLREFLTHEATMNVPYFRAVMAEQRVSSQAAVLFDKLRVLTNGTAAAVQQDEEVCRAKGGRSLGRRSASDRPRGLAKGRKAQQQHQSALDAMGEDSYQGVQEEVSRIPLQCERLRLCVQAGWFLPPPVVGPNNKPTGGGSTVANRALSNFAEALLLSLPPTVPRLHLGVELELEKHLWEDHRALCDDSAEVQQLLCEARVLYTQNVILRRFAGKCGVLEASLKKLASEAAAEM